MDYSLDVNKNSHKMGKWFTKILTKEVILAKVKLEMLGTTQKFTP